jgi:hypothetical protein
MAPRFESSEDLRKEITLEWQLYLQLKMLVLRLKKY